MTYTYEDVKSTLIEHTTMQKMVADGVHTLYKITPDQGFVLHDASFDTWIDEDGNELKEPILGYRTTSATCTADYDFKENPRKFYAVPKEGEA